MRNFRGTKIVNFACFCRLLKYVFKIYVFKKLMFSASAEGLHFVALINSTVYSPFTKSVVLYFVAVSSQQVEGRFPVSRDT